MFECSYFVIILCSRTTHSENNTTTVQNVSTQNRLADKLTTDVCAQVNSRDTPVCTALTRTNSVLAKTREFQNIFDKNAINSTSDVNRNITGIYLFNRYALSFLKT